MTLKEAYEDAAKRGKGIIVNGVIGGRKNDPRLMAYIEQHAGRQVGLADETRGFVIVRLKPGRQ